MPRNLLLADDSVTIQKVVAMTLAGEDFDVVAVDNGEDALARARAAVPDLIVADVAMPRKDGYELCAAVKADPALRKVPVLLLAGSSEPLDEARARAAQADGHVTKPFESGAFIAKVKELVDSGAVAAPAQFPRLAAVPAPAYRPPSPVPPVPPAPPEPKPPHPDPEVWAEVELDGLEALDDIEVVPPLPPPPAGAGAAVGADGGEALLREAISRASREVLERVAWEVVPQLAETIIREQLERLIASRERGIL